MSWNGLTKLLLVWIGSTCILYTHLGISQLLGLTMAQIANVKKMALEWNKKVFEKVENEIKLKQNQLQQLQDSIVNAEDVRKERDFRKELEDLLNRE